MANGVRDNFLVNPWKEYCYSNGYHNPLFYPNAVRVNNQLAWLPLPTHYTPHLARCDGQGIGLIRARTIGHQDGSSSQPRQQDVVHWRAILQQVPPCDLEHGGSQYPKVYTAIPGQFDPQILPASTPGYIQSPCIAPLRLADGVSNITSNEQKTPGNDENRRCPVCSTLLGRSQERRRHIVSHLPFWLQCPDLACSWRGGRWETLRKHRRNSHPSSGPGYDKSNSIIYNPWPLVEEITEGTTHVKDAGDLAISMVMKRALELGKLGIWGDFWGRKRRKLRRARATITATEVDPSV